MSVNSDAKADSAFEADWNGVLANYEQCRKTYQAALDSNAKTKRAAARDYWQAVALILHCYNRPGNWHGDTKLHGSGGWAAPRFAFPPSLAKVLGNHADYLSVGQLPATCADVVGKGRTAPGPHERRDRAIAVATVHAIKAGELPGGKISAVAQAFGVSPRTLQKWVAEMDWVSKDTFGAPAPPGALVLEAKDRHRQVGRSASAIAKRSSKRSEHK